MLPVIEALASVSFSLHLLVTRNFPRRPRARSSQQVAKVVRSDGKGQDREPLRASLFSLFSFMGLFFRLLGPLS